MATQKKAEFQSQRETSRVGQSRRRRPRITRECVVNAHMERKSEKTSFSLPIPRMLWPPYSAWLDIMSVSFLCVWLFRFKDGRMPTRGGGSFQLSPRFLLLVN